MNGDGSDGAAHNGGRIRTIEGGGVMWWCPACKCGHGGPGWKETKPGTIFPSAIVQGQSSMCHSIVVDYQIRFCPDSTNGWALKVVDLEAF